MRVEGARHLRFGAPAWLSFLLLTMSIAACSPPERAVSDTAVPSPVADEEADGQAVVDAHRALVAAYESGDVEGFATLVDSDPNLLIFHPRLQNRFDGVPALREHLPTMFARIGRVVWTDFHATVSVEGDVAWLTSEMLLESPSFASPFVGRATEIWLRRPAGWRLTHGHWSANPDSDPG